jgi:hypothetical protein
VGTWPAGAGSDRAPQQGSIQVGGAVKPDIILAWDASESVARLIRTAHQGVPVVVCAWAHRQRWPQGTEIVPLPFNAERVATTLTQKLQRKEVRAPRPRAA